MAGCVGSGVRGSWMHKEVAIQGENISGDQIPSLGLQSFTSVFKISESRNLFQRERRSVLRNFGNPNRVRSRLMHA